ncbi:unnamed protein product [Arctia plantaginis]|uniref:Secreted protein n=1 Tax=Arctia plantaginis TaxID=874455 RepID=A0A8S1AS51_ARCPL|nr:unnamed protein product [Arctia plantaginis]CAB3249297.1 unnamed protein product [Arctia plantaginis]
MIVLTCFALVVCINAKALNNSKVTSTPDKITFLDSTEIKKSQLSPVLKRNVNAQTTSPTVSRSIGDSSKNKLPAIDNRVAIRAGSCPLGYDRVGGFCVPSDY